VVFLEGILSEFPAGKTLAEVGRILKPGGYICVSDSIWLKRPVPSNIAEIWETLNRKVSTMEELVAVFEARGFATERMMECSDVLASYYEQFYREVRERVRNKFMGEKHMKGLIRHYKHEIDMYLKFGGSDYMGYGVLMGRKRVDSGE
jgi:SAM-dependent methyltransferase